MMGVYVALPPLVVSALKFCVEKPASSSHFKVLLYYLYFWSSFVAPDSCNL